MSGTRSRAPPPGFGKAAGPPGFPAGQNPTQPQGVGSGPPQQLLKDVGPPGLGDQQYPPIGQLSVSATGKAPFSLQQPAQGRQTAPDVSGQGPVAQPANPWGPGAGAAATVQVAGPPGLRSGPGPCPGPGPSRVVKGKTSAAVVVAPCDQLAAAQAGSRFTSGPVGEVDWAARDAKYKTHVAPEWNEALLEKAARAHYHEGISLRNAAQKYQVSFADLKLYYNEHADGLFGGGDGDDAYDDY